MAKTGDPLYDLVESLNRRVQSLEEAVNQPLASVTTLRQPDPLALPSHLYYIEKERSGRASAFFRSNCFVSTISWMDALKACHAHSLGILDTGLSIQWRKLKTGWVWWFSTEVDGEWIASEDFNSVRMCILAAHFNSEATLRKKVGL